MMLGSHVMSPGNMINNARTMTELIKAKMKVILNMPSMDVPVVLPTMNTFVPTGGVIKPMVQETMTMTPNHIGSTFNGSMIGSTMGTVINMTAMLSINMNRMK